MAQNTVLPNDLCRNATHTRQAHVRKIHRGWVCPPVPERGEEQPDRRRGCLSLRYIRRDRGHIGKYLSLGRGTLGVPGVRRIINP